MADDIVTRLRDRLEESFCHCVEDPFFVCSYCAIEEAADEIESLRAKLALTEDEMVRMARMMSEMTESYRQLRQEYEKVRGDA